jgi:multidrug efflux pump
LKFAHFFIDRPIFAAVLSIVLVVVGAIAALTLPVSEYPEIAPPTIVVQAVYPGASPRVLAETVAMPIEQEINGVEGMLYLSSQATSDGVVQVTVTFELGTDLDIAQVQVQNRVKIAEPKLPEDVRRLGVTTTKRSPDLTVVVQLVSDGRYDPLYMANFALRNVKDQLARIKGVGQINLFGGADYSMRVWLDPEALVGLKMTPSDVVKALREQNVQVAAGVIGRPPTPTGVPFQFSVNAMGRLTDEAQFEQIVIRTGDGGQIVRLKDVARVEIGGKDYNLQSYLSGQPAVALVLFQLPGSNALTMVDNVRAKMDELSAGFPEGLRYEIIYDTTVFVRESIKSVVRTLIEAIVLVVLVVLVFLQNWRSTIIPLLAVPVSLVGTFAAMAAFGFSLNNLSLFGLVLAIGIVVDDAIVVVENVERWLAEGLSPREATHKAMDEVTGPVIATTLVLIAVFVPTAFIPGISGQFYKQFAVTIAVSTAISSFNSLTLSPALAALLLKPHGAKKDPLELLMAWTVGWFFKLFNVVFDFVTKIYTAVVSGLIRVAPVPLVVYAALLVATGWLFMNTPTGFIPAQDKGYLIANLQMPDASSLERTDKALQKMEKIALDTPGVMGTFTISGYAGLSGSNASNYGAIFVVLDEFEKRKKDKSQGGVAILGKLNQEYAKIEEGMALVFPPPPVSGIGNAGGFKLQLQDKEDRGLAELQKVSDDLMAAAAKRPEFAAVFSTFRANVPQLFVEVDREQAKQQGVAVTDIFDTLQIAMGSLYVNDFNKFGRTYQVTAQADAKFRVQPDDILKLQTRNRAGEMVPLGSVARVLEQSGPDRVTRYNLYPSSDINGVPMPGISSGAATGAMEALAAEVLPPGYGYEWTELTLQEKLAGNLALLIFPLCVLFAFLTLAAQYESWSLPLAVILIVPMCLLSAIAGVYFSGQDNNIFTQIGLVVLVGLACKNAILIVEFAKALQDGGKSRRDSAVEAAKLRLRPILMTSFAFILGVVPLVRASGAGAEMRQALGTAVFWGMLGVTVFGIFLTPVFYVVIRWLTDSRKVKGEAPAAVAVAAPAGH